MTCFWQKRVDIGSKTTHTGAKTAENRAKKRQKCPKMAQIVPKLSHKTLKNLSKNAKGVPCETPVRHPKTPQNPRKTDTFPHTRPQKLSHNMFPGRSFRVTPSGVILQAGS